MTFDFLNIPVEPEYYQGNALEEVNYYLVMTYLTRAVYVILPVALWIFVFWKKKDKGDA